jgi:tetratricopeptide (TPR) repeat protein
LTRGSLVKTENPAQTRADFEQALKCDPNDWRNWHYLLDFLADQQEHVASLKLAEKAFRKFNGAMVPGMDYASALFYNQQFGACLKILEKIELLPYEGAWEGHHLFVQANLKLALEKMQGKNWRRAIQYLAESKTYPEHLGTGEPFDPDFRLQDFLIAHCEAKLGNAAGAKSVKQGISEYTRRNWLEWGSQHFWGALVLRELGQPEPAESLLRAWSESQPQNLLAQWCLAKFRGEAAEEGYEKKLLTNQTFVQFREIIKLTDEK